MCDVYNLIENMREMKLQETNECQGFSPKINLKYFVLDKKYFRWVFYLHLVKAMYFIENKDYFGLYIILQWMYQHIRNIERVDSDIDESDRLFFIQPFEDALHHVGHGDISIAKNNMEFIMKEIQFEFI